MHNEHLIRGFNPRISIRKLAVLFHTAFFLLTIYCLPPNISAQKIAFLAPDNSPSSQNTRQNLEDALSKNFKILDDSPIENVLANSPVENIFNLSSEEARNFGNAAGCNFFVLIKSATLRRATLAKPFFYIESYTAAYLVSTRTGHLILWKLESFKAPTAAAAEAELSASIKNLASEIAAKIKSESADEADDEPPPKIEELPEENSVAAQNFRSPLPYRRLKPAYTALANLYDVTATVDAAVDLNAKGDVTKVEITRWAGYGLDESVAETIRKMQWRAATRDGKSLPIRVLLRYNFKKIESDQ